MLRSQTFHFFGTAEYIKEQVADISRLRDNASPHAAGLGRPFIIWEPQAKSCLPETLDDHLLAARYVDVFSPNHEELAAFWEESDDASADSCEEFDKHLVENRADQFLQAGIGSLGTGCIVVRAAGYGCMVLSGGVDNPICQWLPSFYASDSHMVVDATGAGNAFLGAFAIGWQETGSYVEAAKYGQVAASFVIEGVGLPVRFLHGERELWNHCSVRQRLAEYQARFDRQRS